MCFKFFLRFETHIFLYNELSEKKMKKKIFLRIKIAFAYSFVSFLKTKSLLEMNISMRIHTYRRHATYLAYIYSEGCYNI